ncbi:MAG: hypothetical protein AAB472_01115 [Patescibacteria group bacterium]
MAYDDHLEAEFQSNDRRKREAREAAEAAKKIKVKIVRVRAMIDPQHDLFNVEIVSTTGEWRETVGSEADLRLLLKGIEAGAAMVGGHATIGDIPTEPLLL